MGRPCAWSPTTRATPAPRPSACGCSTDASRNHETARSGPMRLLARDFAIGLRGLRRSPGFALVAIATMALGVGATSAIYSIVNGVLLNGLPWKDPSTAVSFELRKQKQNAEPRGVTPAQYRDFQQQLKAFS